MTMQAALKVMANDSAVTTAAALGDFELNAFSPLIADALLESLALLCRAVPLFRTKCIETLRPEPNRCARLLDDSWAFAAAYVPRLGYENVRALIAENQGDPAKIRAALEGAAGRNEGGPAVR
jgi:aspartate ammonia-lyase